MDWFKKHKVISVILGLIVLGVIVSAAGGGKSTTNTGSSNNQAATTQKPAEKPKLDIAAFYSKVQNGMTKDEVVALADKNAGNCTESETQGFGKYEICNWYGNFGDNAFATVTFKDGKVDSKSKTGF
jgi:hypothetical protein